MNKTIKTTKDALAEIASARTTGRRPNLRGANLQGAILWVMDLRYADLRGANLRHTDLRDSDLRDAILEGADLREANLRHTNLRYANLRYVNLRGADLRDVNLRDADLRHADLRDVRLWHSDLRDVDGGVLHIPCLPSGDLYMVPTPNGWRINVGCWPNKKAFATMDDLAAILDAPDEDWPEARDDERKRREPILRAVHAHCVAHADYHSHLIDGLAEEWGIDAEKA